MSCYWEIEGELKPIKEKTQEFLSAMEEYYLDYSDIGNGFYSVQYDGDGYYEDKDDIIAELVETVESGKIRFVCKMYVCGFMYYDDDDAVMYAFRNGECIERSGRMFLYFEGIDDPLEFAKKLPEDVAQAILAHAEEFRHD